MKSYKEMLQEAEGFQGKFTPDRDTKRQAIEVGKKVNPKPSKGGALAVTPKRAARDRAVRMAGDFVKRKAGDYAKKKVSDVGGKLAKRPGHKDPKVTSNFVGEPVKQQGPLQAGGKEYRKRVMQKPVEVSDKAKERFSKGKKFMHKGVMKALRGPKQQTGTSSSSLKGSGTQNWGASMK